MCCNVFSLAIGTYFEKRVFVMNGFVYLYDLLHSLRILVFQLLLSSRKKQKQTIPPHLPCLLKLTPSRQSCLATLLVCT